ncbi:MAG: crossover junction endodeoxyribonuclease RuvC [Candidatus Coatesbacteria bacterium]|nr:crossover junction endodeoxyribonuclease RuvC [Candidatus Coatesbacteria bacterium]
MSLISLGVDPGLYKTGYALIDDNKGKPKLLEAGLIKPKSKDGLDNRLFLIYTELSKIIEEFKVGILIVEELYSHYAHPKTAILMGHARGVVCMLAAQYKIPLYGYSATMVKKLITGNGRATKEQVRRGVFYSLNLREQSIISDVSDAIAIALAHFYSETRMKV